MPTNNYTRAGFTPRNTLFESKRRPPTAHVSTRGALATVTSRGENVKRLAPHIYDFQRPDPKRRKKDHPLPPKEDLSSSDVIDLAQDDDPPPSRAIDKTSRTRKQKPFHIPAAITGVQESRNVNRIVSSSFTSRDVGAPRSKIKPRRGQTQDQPVELDDDSQKSLTQASNEPMDTMTALDNSLVVELERVNSQNKRRPSSTARTSHHFANSKRPRAAMADFVKNSDDELEEMALPLTNGVKKRRHGMAEPIRLRRIFKADDRVSRPNRSAFNQNEEDQNMTDELAEIPENGKRTNVSSKQAGQTLPERETFEIPETPSPPTDDYTCPADIPPTPFGHGKDATTKKGKGAKKKSSKEQREDVYPLESYRDLLNTIGHDQPGLQLEPNDANTCFNLRFRSDGSLNVATIDVAQIRNLSWSSEECRHVRLSGSRDSASTRTRIWDLEFSRQDSAKKFVLQLDKNIKRYPRQAEEMRRMFQSGLSEAKNQPAPDDVADRGVEDAFYERKAHWDRIAPSSIPDQQSTQSRPPKPRTLVSALKASVPDGIQLESREKGLPEIKYETETEVQSASARPKRSTRTIKAPVRSSTPEIERYSATHGLGEPWDEPVVYPGRDKTDRSKKQVAVEFDDLFRLDEGEWFNDSLVEYCLLRYQQQNQMQAKKVYFFSNFFYSKLVAKPGKNIDYEAVRRWVKDDIFSYDFVVVPVCENAHWYLVLICNLTRLKKKLADDEGEVVEEFKAETLEHEVQPDKVSITGVPEDTVNKAEHQTRQADLDNNLNSPSRHPENKVVEDEEAMDLVGTRVGDTKKVSESNDGVHTDTVSGSHTRSTAIPGTKKKAKRHPTVRKYAPDTPAIAILDSMPMGAKHGNTVNALKDFLVAEANAKHDMEIKRESLQGMHITRGIPMQDNFSDCGLFLCRYVRELLKDPEGFTSKLFAGELDNIEWGSWDTNEVRDTIRKELQALAAEQSKQRKAKAEKKRLKRAELNNVPVETAMKASKVPPDTPPDLPTSSPLKACSPMKASSPVGASKTIEAVYTAGGPADLRNLPKSPVRSPDPGLQTSSTLRVSNLSDRVGSEGPRFSARSSPAGDSLYLTQENSIPVYEDDAQSVASEREPQGLMREDGEEVMLHDEQIKEGEVEEPEWRGFDDVEDDDEQEYKNQLLKAASFTGGGEVIKDDHMDVDESDAVSDASQDSPRFSSPATRLCGSQNSQGISALPSVQGIVET
ncbi:Signal recognition particle [Venturia nashicola]|uniref:Signal recognition particle n=1 Tax=Venturia nashicola TaxID=86259 RepID=A0A4Z1P7H3_9PEZI|nr:Signal recognition particle [Venturia nashicola]